MRYSRVLGIGCCLLCLITGCAGGVRVRRGDTLYSISRRHDVPLRALIEENRLRAPYTLSVGQYLRLPRTTTYRVRRGDTLYSVATRHNMTVSRLARLNDIRAPYTIHHGQVLKLSSWNDTESTAAAVPKASAGKTKTKAVSTATKTVQSSKTPTDTSRKAQVPKAQAGKTFAWPVKGPIVSDFGSGNDGINIAGTAGTAVKAADSGTIAYAGNELKGYGHLVLIKHPNGWITAYAHNRKLLVKKNEAVKKGQKIAEMGNTGHVKTPQLHFEIRYKAKVVNPRLYLK